MNQQQPGDQRPHDETGPLAAHQPAAGATAVADAPHPPPPYPPGATAPKRSNPLRRVPRAAWLAAAAVVVLVGVGLGGFFIGRATADGDGGFPDRGQRPDFPGGGPGRDGQMPGMPGQDGQLPGQQGQQGQPGSSTGDGTDGSTTEGSADTTSWYVVPQAA